MGARSFLLQRLVDWKRSAGFSAMLSDIMEGRELRKWAGRATCIPFRVWESLATDYFCLDPGATRTMPPSVQSTEWRFLVP